MSATAEKAIAQLDELLAEIDPKLHAQQSAFSFIAPEPKAIEMKTRALAAIRRLAAPESPYRAMADDAAKESLPSRCGRDALGRSACAARRL